MSACGRCGRQLAKMALDRGEPFCADCRLDLAENERLERIERDGRTRTVITLENGVSGVLYTRGGAR